MAKDVILTGIRANQDLTIGNYFGAILPIIDMAKKRSEEFQINMFIPDLHSFTTPIDHSKLNKQILDNAKLFAAAGLPLDNENIYMYRQSYIPAHSELTVILNAFSRFDELYRMTQFKSKAGISELVGEDLVFNRFAKYFVNHSSVQQRIAEIKNDVGSREELKVKYIEFVTNLSVRGHEIFRAHQNETIFKQNKTVSAGLYDYPVLMASDILLYNAKYVPVGDDQTQHLEFTRDIAQRMNKKFGDTRLSVRQNGQVFTVPESVPKQHEFFGNDQGLRIKDLIDPTKKMSKSDDSGRGVIFLNDEPSIAAKKVMGATTDDKAEINFDYDNQPGISNLLEILSLLQGSTLQEVVDKYEGQTKYGEFKAVVAGEVEKFLTDFQKKLSEVDETAVIVKLEQSERDLTPLANETLLRVQQAVGLRPKGN